MPSVAAADDGDSDDDPTRAEALPGIAEALRKRAQASGPAAAPAGSFGMLPDLAADVDPPQSSRGGEVVTRAVPPFGRLPDAFGNAFDKEVPRAPESNRVVYDDDAGGYEATLAVSLAQSSNGEDKIAAALAEALQVGLDNAVGASTLSMVGQPPPRPPMFETLQTPQYPVGYIPKVAPGTPALSASGRLLAVPASPSAAPRPSTQPMQAPAPAPPGMYGGPALGPAPPLVPAWLQGGSPNRYGQTPSQPYPPPGAASSSRQSAQGMTPGTKQVVLLVVVGVICLAIFVVGVVLFFTTPF